MNMSESPAGRSIMKKYTKILLTLCIVFGMISTVYAAEAPFEYKEKELVDNIQGIITEVNEFDTDDVLYYAKNSLGITKTVCEDYYNYKKDDTLGKFVEFKETKVENAEASVNVTVTAVYEKQTITITATYKEVGKDIVLYDVKTSADGKTPVVSDKNTENEDGENKSQLDVLKNAGLNTLMGISIVVLMLAFIAMLISLFRFIPVLQEKFAKKKDVQTAAVENVVAQIEQKEELSNDTELIAVITAAICAAENASSDSFVVRSIRKTRFK